MVAAGPRQSHLRGRDPDRRARVPAGPGLVDGALSGQPAARPAGAAGGRRDRGPAAGRRVAARSVPSSSGSTATRTSTTARATSRSGWRRPGCPGARPRARVGRRPAIARGARARPGPAGVPRPGERCRWAPSRTSRRRSRALPGAHRPGPSPTGAPSSCSTTTRADLAVGAAAGARGRRRAPGGRRPAQPRQLARAGERGRRADDPDDRARLAGRRRRTSPAAAALRRARHAGAAGHADLDGRAASRSARSSSAAADAGRFGPDDQALVQDLAGPDRGRRRAVRACSPR